MLFTGEYEHSLDTKLRLAIPADIRSKLKADVHGDGFYVVPGPNGALWMWPQRTFEQIAGALEQSLLPTLEMMEFEELLFSQAARLELDKAGRVRIPDRLLKLASIEQSAVVLGVKDHLELWNPIAWADRLGSNLAKQGEIMLRARDAWIEHLRRSRRAQED